MAAFNANPLDQSIFATSIPPEVAEARGRSEYAPVEGIGDPYHERGLDGHDIKAAPTTTAQEKLGYPTPNKEELSTLVKVSDKIPITNFLCSLCRRVLRTCFIPKFHVVPATGGRDGAGAPAKGTRQTAGALGKGLQSANTFVLLVLFTFLSYAIPLLGTWMVDTRIGRYKTITIGVLICGISHVILVIGVIPSVLRAGDSHSPPPFIIGFFFLAFGAGLFKPNMAPTFLDQYQHQRQFTKVLKSGQKSIVDPETIVQQIMLIFYGLINVGVFFDLATTYCGKDVGYWLAYLLPGILYLHLPHTIKFTPSSSLRSAHIFRKGLWDPARPSKGLKEHRGTPVSWDGALVDDDAHSTSSACQIFLYFFV